MIANRPYLAEQIQQLLVALVELDDWTENPARPFPGDAVALADQLNWLRALLLADGDMPKGTPDAPSESRDNHQTLMTASVPTRLSTENTADRSATMTPTLSTSSLIIINGECSIDRCVLGPGGARIVVGELPDSVEFALDFTALGALMKAFHAALAEMAELQIVKLSEQDPQWNRIPSPSSVTLTRGWADNSVDTAIITSPMAAYAKRENPGGREVWSAEGTVEQVVAALLDLPEPGAPDAPDGTGHTPRPSGSRT